MVPLGATGSAATDDLQPVFAMLTLIDNRPQLETVRFDKTAVGHAFSPHFAPIFCRIGSDRTPLDVAAVGDATMDPQAHWLVERPRTSRGSVSATARLRRLDWFRICARPNETGACAPSDRQWHVEVYDLGPNVDLQQDGLMPKAPADIPAVTPRFLDGETAAKLAPALARPSDPTGQLHTDASDTAPEAQAGDALYWGAQPLVNARPGFKIPAYAFDQGAGLLAYVATTLAPNARAAASSQGPTTCEGQELCTHYLRILHFDPEHPEAEDGTRVPLLEVLFVAPPIDRMAFGEEELAGDLLFHFAGVDGAARLTWDRKIFKNWICRVYVSDTSAEPTSGYTQAFENFAISAAAESISRKAIIERACNAS